MYISKLTMKNFKSFNGTHELELKPGINYFVGDNNCGKTTIFQAIQFIVSRENKEDVLSKVSSEEDEVSVSLVLEDVELSKSSKYYSYLEKGKFELKPPINIDAIPHLNRTDCLKYSKFPKFNPQLIPRRAKLIKIGKLTLKRSSKEESIKQKGKEKKLSINTVRVWNVKEQQFENPAGADRVITELFAPQFIYADLHNEEMQDFSSTKPVGGLVKTITEDFQEGSVYQEFKVAHAKAFGKEGILNPLEEIQSRINEKLSEQFGEAKVRFSFDLPGVPDFLKKGSLFITENNIETSASQKGNGMQRALALAIIQILADNKKVNSSKSQFFIDEPEIFLHPSAQDKLLRSLKKLSQNQIFITTHSPYILRHFRNRESDSIIILSNKSLTRISEIDTLLFGKTSIGEVTYRAFDVPTVDFHQQLFVRLYLNWIEEKKPRKPTLAIFDDYLIKEYNLNKFEYTPRNNGEWKDPQKRTLPYIVRNEIDHPEVLEEDKNVWSEENLKDSIEIMLRIFKKTE